LSIIQSILDIFKYWSANIEAGLLRFQLMHNLVWFDADSGKKGLKIRKFDAIEQLNLVRIQLVTV